MAEADKTGLSFVPLLLQEANYDDLSWMCWHENLRQLSCFFELDDLVQCGGQACNEASAGEFAAYVEEALRAIRMWPQSSQDGVSGMAFLQ